VVKVEEDLQLVHHLSKNINNNDANNCIYKKLDNMIYDFIYFLLTLNL